MIGIRACVKVMLLISSVSLVACSTQNNLTLNPSSRGILVANYTVEQETLLRRLQEKQIGIIKAGEQVTLILPADEFFQPCSSVIRVNAYSVFNEIVMLLRTYPKTSVIITGYTDNLGSSQRNMALSRQRARVTADYLWSQDVDTRLLYTEGKGSDGPLADNASLNGQRWNRRIEITFQRLPE